ncbi:MAG: hypothetical protein HYV32_02500 [Candidatus Kerfeldbacteria bacterium]|nr:hypothetical protein [Candidatus Kerfeldbacteria bacterium]
MSLEVSRSRQVEQQEHSPLRVLAAQEEKALQTVAPERRRRAAAWMTLSTLLAGEMVAPVAAHAQESGRQEQSAEYGTENTGLEKTVRELQPPSVEGIGGRQVFNQRIEIIGSAELIPISAKSIAHWPERNIIVSASTGYYTADVRTPKRTTARAIRTEHVEIFEIQPALSIEKIGRTTTYTALGFTADEAIAKALRGAAEYFESHIDTETRVDTKMTNFSKKIEESNGTEVSNSLTTRGIIASYTLDQPPHREGEYWSVTITAQEGRLKP